jgi:hypothetical protein
MRDEFADRGFAWRPIVERLERAAAAAAIPVRTANGG